MTLWMPMWLLRRIVRRNPWLMADGGAINRAVRLDLWLVSFEAHGAMHLTPKCREKLLSEARDSRA